MEILNQTITIGQALAAVGAAVAVVALSVTVWMVYIIRKKERKFWVNPLNIDEWN